jgi:Pyridine nucleotide-disulphide oxidoreductase, dimerisation domain
MDYDLVPTVVFSHPTIGTIGLTEEEAVARHGADNIKTYNSTFVNLWYGPFYGGGQSINLCYVMSCHVTLTGCGVRGGGEAVLQVQTGDAASGRTSHWAAHHRRRSVGKSVLGLQRVIDDSALLLTQS